MEDSDRPQTPASDPAAKPSSRRFDWLTILILLAALANGLLYVYNRNKTLWFGEGTTTPVMIPGSRPVPPEGFGAPPAGTNPPVGMPPPAGETPPPGQPPAPPVGEPAKPGRSILQ